MLSLFLGAGFSKWAANLPVMSQLFDFDIEPHNDRDRRKLDSIISYKERWDAENPNVYAELFVRETLQVSERKKKLVLWYITRRLSDPFISWVSGGTQALMIDDKRAQSHEGVRKTQGFLKQCPRWKMAGIITTNYDLLVEYALGTSWFNYGVRGECLVGRGKNPSFPWQGGPVILNGRMKLAKIHGSISWDQNNHYTDGRSGVKGDALIIPPIPEKAPPSALQETWQLASSILQHSTHLIVFGFAFNPYDEAVLNMLQQSGTNLRSIILLDIQPKLDTARELWPHASVIGCAPPPDDDGIFSSWMDQFWLDLN